MSEDFLSLRVGGHTCRLRLLLDRAPNTCTSLKAVLPVQSHLVRAKFAGDEVYFMVPGAWPAENPATGVEAGDVGYYPDRQTVCIFYGGIVPFGSVGLFARVADGLDALRAVGPDLWRHGALPIRLDIEDDQ
ncbi:MAG TPA: cyclophilin-like fold protein [bacterium]|nr:cyclophilin-like fold protein [bacterium]